MKMFTETKAIRSFLIAILCLIILAAIAEAFYVRRVSRRIEAAHADLQKRLAEIEFDWDNSPSHPFFCKITDVNYLYEYQTCFDGGAGGRQDFYKYLYTPPRPILSISRILGVPDIQYFGATEKFSSTIAIIYADRVWEAISPDANESSALVKSRASPWNVTAKGGW